MGYTFRRAADVDEPTPLLVGAIGGTGSGKTFSAFRIARGLVGPKGKIAMLDTEKRRSLHYRKDFEFDFAEIAPPFTPEAYRSAIEAAEKQGYGAIIIDSMSHVWSGDGGILDMHDQAVERMSKGDWKKAEAVSALAWSEPKQRYKRFISRLLQCRAHLIICLRAEMKLKAIKVVEDGKEKTKFVDGGWLPICEKHLPFELTCSFLMTAEQKGIPQPLKLPETMRRFFPEGEQVTERAGELLAQWSADPHFGLEIKQGKGGVPAPKKDEEGRLQLFGADGSVMNNYANAATWLAGLKKALTEALAATTAGELWDRNQDLFYKIQEKATKKEEAKLIDTCAEIGRLAIAKSTPPQEQGDLLGARA